MGLWCSFVSYKNVNDSASYMNWLATCNVLFSLGETSFGLTNVIICLLWFLLSSGYVVKQRDSSICVSFTLYCCIHYSSKLFRTLLTLL